MTKHYTNILEALEEAGVSAEGFCASCGQGWIDIYGEQGQVAVSLYFDFDSDGNETFVCQE